MTIELLLTFVNVGMAARATARTPRRQIRRRFGIMPRNMGSLYWQANGPVGKDYKVFVHLLDSNYAMFGGNDSEPKPQTLGWKPGATVEDTRSFDLPAETPAGSYQIEVGLYDLHRHRLPMLTDEGAEGATHLLLGPLDVKTD